jgi:4-alpha-glucanotransferase
MAFPRSSGVLLHPTSLPSRDGIGDLGEGAYRVVDFLAAAGQRWWQVLPLSPTGLGNSPYASDSAFATNPLLISPDILVGDGLLAERDLPSPQPPTNPGRVDYARVRAMRLPLLERAFAQFQAGAGTSRLRLDHAQFVDREVGWLRDYALFAAIQEARGGTWDRWPGGLATRDRVALEAVRTRLRQRIEAHTFFQFLFDRQWRALRAYAAERGIGIIGDMPIFVGYQSADVWARPDLYRLDAAHQPVVVAGVPPDAFSATGQRWGNPVYDWVRMREDGFAWWVARLRRTLELVDVVRVDHFRGFAATWEIPAGEETAEQGEWVAVPGHELFHALRTALGPDLPIIAEDLGTITPDVHRLRDAFGFPGMRVLQFAFGGDPHDVHLPHEYHENTVVYTGTHDNDTVAGWWDARRTASEGAFAFEADVARRYLATSGDDMPWTFIRTAFLSVSAIAMVPLQDLLGLGSWARMNTPATAEGNWEWRFDGAALDSGLSHRLHDLTWLSGRRVLPSAPA